RTHKTVQPFAMLAGAPHHDEVRQLGMLEYRAWDNARRQLGAAFDVGVRAGFSEGVQGCAAPLLEDERDVVLIIHVGGRAQRGRDVAQEGAFQQFHVDYVQSREMGLARRGKRDGVLHAKRRDMASVGGNKDALNHAYAFKRFPNARKMAMPSTWLFSG